MYNYFSMKMAHLKAKINTIARPVTFKPLFFVYLLQYFHTVETCLLSLKERCTNI